MVTDYISTSQSRIGLFNSRKNTYVNIFSPNNTKTNEKRRVEFPFPSFLPRERYLYNNTIIHFNSHKKTTNPTHNDIMLPRAQHRPDGGNNPSSVQEIQIEAGGGALPRCHKSTSSISPKDLKPL